MDFEAWAAGVNNATGPTGPQTNAADLRFLFQTQDELASIPLISCQAWSLSDVAGPSLVQTSTGEGWVRP